MLSPVGVHISYCIREFSCHLTLFSLFEFYIATGIKCAPSNPNNNVDRPSGLLMDINIITSIFAYLDYKYVVRASCLAKCFSDV